jgi:hypothetical protein
MLDVRKWRKAKVGADGEEEKTVFEKTSAFVDKFQG